MLGHGRCHRDSPWPSIEEVFAPLFSKSGRFTPSEIAGLPIANLFAQLGQAHYSLIRPKIKTTEPSRGAVKNKNGGSIHA